MGIAPYLKVIGRGREGARSLEREQAADLMSQVLDGAVTDLEVGAFALAMRIKGETVAELAGFLDVIETRCIAVPADRPVIVLPSYNGARRLPNLTPLLAMLLARAGLRVLVHGNGRDPGRVTTAQIFGELGLVGAESGADIAGAWARGEPSFIPTEALCPPLARLLALRDVIGLRNSGHTAAKLLAPCRGVTMRVVNHTHPEYGALLAGFLAATGADAMLMRGTEGEPVADARRLQRLAVFIGGVLRPELSLPAQEGVLTPTATLPRGHDAASTARTIEAIVGGVAAAPAPIAAQVACLVRALAAIVTRPAAPPVPAGAQ